MRGRNEVEVNVEEMADRGRRMAVAIRLLRLGGLWREEGDGAVYGLYHAAVTFNSFFIVLLFGACCVAVPPGARMENLGNMLTFAPYCVAVSSAVRQAGAYRLLVAGLWASERRHLACFSPRAQRLLDDALRTEARIARYYSVATGFTIGWYMVAPFLGGSGLELPIKVPEVVEPTSALLFVAEYIFQLLVVGLMSVSCVPLDIFSYALMMHVAGQFECLAEWLSAADSRHQRRLSSLQHQREPTASHLPTHIDDVLDQDLNQLVALHQDYLADANRLADVLSPVLFSHYLLASLTLCLVMYQFVMVEDNTQKIKNCFHMLCTMFRLLNFSYLSSLLNQKSEALRHTAYGCGWYNYGSGGRITVHMLICRAQRPVLMRAGHFAVMSLETFATLIRGSYSYFNILDQTYSS